MKDITNNASVLPPRPDFLVDRLNLKQDGSGTAVAFLPLLRPKPTKTEARSQKRKKTVSEGGIEAKRVRFRDPEERGPKSQRRSVADVYSVSKPSVRVSRRAKRATPDVKQGGRLSVTGQIPFDHGHDTKNTDTFCYDSVYGLITAKRDEPSAICEDID